MMQADQQATTQTTLHRNPFFVIKATTRDTSNRIIELEREYELSDNAGACRKVKARTESCFIRPYFQALLTI
jgi:hypothetical protein